MYSQYRVIKAAQCLLLPPGTTPAEGASCFVNPLTAIGMVETMKLEGHKALVHTAAASNLGQMLSKLCNKDSIGLVNIVRKPEHVKLLKSIGAMHVVRFEPTDVHGRSDERAGRHRRNARVRRNRRRQARRSDPHGMEIAANKTAKEYSRYGSTTHKQVYIYGGLDRSPTEFNRNFGMAWGIGGWLLTPFLQKIGPAEAQKLRERVAVGDQDDVREQIHEGGVARRSARSCQEIAVYGKQATGEKYLIDPNKGLR